MHYGVINAAVASGELRQSCGCEKLREQFCDYSGPVAANITPTLTLRLTPTLTPTPTLTFTLTLTCRLHHTRGRGIL